MGRWRRGPVPEAERAGATIRRTETRARRRCRQLRERRGLTQAALAKRLGSSQSRVAKMEAADTSVSLDLMMRSLLSIGATAGEIARLIKKTEAANAQR